MSQNTPIGGNILKILDTGLPSLKYPRSLKTAFLDDLAGLVLLIKGKLSDWLLSELLSASSEELRKESLLSKYFLELSIADNSR